MLQRLQDSYLDRLSGQISTYTIREYELVDLGKNSTVRYILKFVLVI